MPPTATLDALDVTASTTTIDFAVTYADDHAVEGYSAIYFGAVDHRGESG